MPKAFVHGNPETSALWGVLFEELRARGETDLVALSPPGFGAPVPEGFARTQDAYRGWLVAELEALGGDVDLVGHDWGAGHVYGALAERPELVRSWAADCVGLIHPDYVWHDAARAWQSEELGEQAVAALFDMPLDQRVATFVAFGIREDAARAIAAEQDQEMARCILALYRSARQPAMASLGERLREGPPLPPGLVIVPTADLYPGTPEMAKQMAGYLGADTVLLEGLGHWWMFAAAAAAADALAAHWRTA